MALWPCFNYVKLLKSVHLKVVFLRICLDYRMPIPKEKQSSLRRRSIQFKTHEPVKQNTSVS